MVQMQQQEQLRMEETRRAEEEKQRMAGMEMSQMTQQMSQMSQMSQSYSQTSSVQQQQSSTSQVYESTQMGGVMKGYKSKTDDELAAERDMTRNSQQFIQDNGIFGGITGDNNSLLQDGQFDSKKHSVKDLVGHFSKVKPRAEIPVQYLPEQRMFNGEQGPSLNYLTTNAESSSESQSMMMRSTTSGVDSAASRQQYENRKAEMNGNSQTSTSSFADQSSSVEMRSKTEASTQQKKILTERRQSLSNYLLLDPAASHASAGIIDPSAILRGADEEGSGDRCKSEGLINPANIAVESENRSGKWDNHNTIARGWAGAKANYHPVTFRNIYNVDSQK